jgi:type I restriction enzyme, R subunit
MASTRSTLNEAQTRQQLIDQQLARAGWGMAERRMLEEYPLSIAEAEPDYGQQPQEFADYVLLGRDGKPLAVIEAKRTSRDALAGKRQASDYADRIRNYFGFDPFIFLTNSQTVLFWDRNRYPPRGVSGFFTREDLERLAYQKRYSIPLNQVEMNTKIAGRDYQTEAIRRVTEAIQAARRKFLLVMATGTGKTRTVIGLIDLLLQAKRVQQVLFLADRRELVRQAASEFKTYLPNENIGRIEGGEISHAARIHVATYPSMMQAYEQLSPGYYDLIIADESHRSIYHRYRAIFDRFDALQVGLTATPTDFIDHNTFQLFGCEDGVPTFNFPFEQAVADRYLVNYRVLEAQTRFQISGIQGEQLPLPLQHAIANEGIDIEEVNFEVPILSGRLPTPARTMRSSANSWKSVGKTRSVFLPKASFSPSAMRMPNASMKALAAFSPITSAGGLPKSSIATWNGQTKRWMTSNSEICRGLRSQLTCSTLAWTFRPFRPWCLPSPCSVG